MHAVRIDEILLRRGGSGYARLLAPTIPDHQEATLGRPFGFLCVNMPRSPQIDALISETETTLEKTYFQGTLKNGQTSEQFFEETVAKIRQTIAAAATKERIKIDPSLITIALGCVVGHDIFLTRHGRCEAYLIRREADRPTKTVDIFRGFENDSDERLLNDMAVGAVADNDLLLFATGSLFDLCPIANIVESTDHFEAAAVAARIRSTILSSPGNESVAGCLVRLTPVRSLFRAKENVSVHNLRSREEEVARTLSPSGLPAVGAFFDRFKTKKKSEPIKLPSDPTGKKSPFIERFNGLPIGTKRAAIVLLALLAIFVVSLKVIAIGNANKANNDKFNTSIETIEKQIDLAESTLIYDETRARSILEGAQTMGQALITTGNEQKTAKAALEARLADADRKLQHLYDVAPKTLETLNAPASFIIRTSSGWITNAGPDLIRLDANGSPTTVATLPDVPVWAAVAADTDNTVYIWLKNNTLVAIAAEPKSLPKSLDYFGPASPIAGAMWGGRLYVLSSDGSQIWKLPPTLTGFGRGSEWLAAKTANAAGLAIDGTIYSAIAGDAIRRFEKGKMTAFAAAGASANQKPLKLALGAENIYLLGADNSIAVWDKSGKLAAQFIISADVGKIIAIAVDETAKSIVFATDKNVISEFTIVK